MSAATTYCFVSPFSTRETVELISKAFKWVGTIKKADPDRGYLLCKYSVSTMRYIKTEFFVQRDDNCCKVRAIIYGDVIITAKDKWWDQFLSALLRVAPEKDFSVTPANGNPYAVGLLYLGGELEQVHTSKTVGGTSLAGFLIGGALFGDAGAIVGGMSGTQRTYGKTHIRFADSQLVRLIYNNGRLWEGYVSKGSKLYNEIMVNFR